MNENDEWKQPRYEYDDEDDKRLNGSGIPWLPIGLALMLVGVFLIMASNAGEARVKDFSTAHVCETVVIGTEAWCSKSD